MLKLLTLNLNGFHDKKGPWKTRRAMIRNLITQHAPDVIALQSVAQHAEIDDGSDQAHQLAHELAGEPTTLFMPANEDGVAEQQGSGFISFLKLHKLSSYPLTLLPGLEDKHRRLLLHAEFDLRDTRLHVFNAHFSWVEEQARQNVQQAMQYLDEHPGPRVLLGDLNNPPDSDVFAPLREAGWQDGWRIARPHQDGATFEAGDWSKRIDYVWLDRAVAPHLIDAQVVGREQDSDGDSYISDHAALLVVLDVQPAA